MTTDNSNDVMISTRRVSLTEQPYRTVVKAPFQGQIRHNPHPFHVRNTFGFLGLPTRFVETMDDRDIKVKWDIKDYLQDTMKRGQWDYKKKFLKKSHDIDEIFALQYFTGLKNFSFKEKYVPYFGYKDYYDQWRGELRNITERVYLPIIQKEQPIPKSASKQIHKSYESPEIVIQQNDSNSKMARLYTSSGRMKTSTPNSSRSKSCNSRSGLSRCGSIHSSRSVVSPDKSQGPINQIDLNQLDATMFMLLSQILRTDNPHDVQKWLSQASEREKALMLSMLEASIKNEPVKQEEERYKDFGTQTSIYSNKKSSNASTVNQLIVNHDTENEETSSSKKMEDEKSNLETPMSLNNEEKIIENRPETSSTFKTKPNSSKLSNDEKKENSKRMWKPKESVGKI